MFDSGGVPVSLVQRVCSEACAAGERPSAIGELFAMRRSQSEKIAGDIDEATFRTCVFRTGLIDEDDVQAEVDQRHPVRPGRPRRQREVDGPREDRLRC